MTQFALRWKGSYPASVIFFRDGVSEGEYEKVSKDEIAEDCGGVGNGFDGWK